MKITKWMTAPAAVLSLGLLAACGHASASRTASPPSDTPSATTVPPQPTQPPPLRVTKIRFIVKGWADASYGEGLDVTWGSSSDDHEYTFTSSFAGTWTRTVKFDPGASYYSIGAQLSGGGNVSVRIVALGPDVVPLTVSHGHAAGGYSIASAQAAPDDRRGSQWMDES